MIWIEWSELFQIVWDPEKKCWVDKNADPSSQEAMPVAPPSDAVLGAGVPPMPSSAAPLMPPASQPQYDVSYKNNQPRGWFKNLYDVSSEYEKGVIYLLICIRLQQMNAAPQSQIPPQAVPLMNIQPQSAPTQPNGIMNKYQRNRGKRMLVIKQFQCSNLHTQI